MSDTTPFQSLQELPEMPGVAKATAATVTPSVVEVQPDALVQNQMNAILDRDDPFVKRARHKAMEVANSLGTLNSSMAAGAGEAAAIDAALPIASQDAGVFQKQQLTNQQAENTAALQDAQAETNVSLSNTDAENQFTSQKYGAELEQHSAAQKQQYGLDALDAEYGHRLTEIQERLAADVDLQTLKNAGALDLQEMRNNAAQMNLDAASYENYLTSHLAVQTMMNNEISLIQNKEGVTAADKTTAIDEVTGRYQDSFAFIDQIYTEALNQWDWSFF